MVVKGTITAGYGVASGQGNDERYPKGTLHLQLPYFQKLGIDISIYHPGTINVNIGNKTVHIKDPKYRAMGIDWSSHIPPENFFFFDVEATYEGQIYSGLIYMPDPATKTEHFQAMSIIELLLPKIPGIKSGNSISLKVEDVQILIQ